MILLKDETHVLLVQRDPALVVELVYLVIVKTVLPGPCTIEHSKDREQRGFAGARGPHDRHEFPCLDVQRNPAQHECLPAGCGIGLVYVPQGDHVVGVL
jgi:hypothetical protein